MTLNRFIAENRPENSAFTRELVYGASRILLYYYLDISHSFRYDKVEKKEGCILRLGLYQIIFMESVPPYAAVNESVNMAKKICRGREGFINGAGGIYEEKHKTS